MKFIINVIIKIKTIVRKNMQLIAKSFFLISVRTNVLITFKGVFTSRFYRAHARPIKCGCY